MNDNTKRLEREEAKLERELAQRSRLGSDTHRQVAEAIRGRRAQAEPERETDRRKWSATEHQVFQANGKMPLKADRDDEGERRA